MSRSSRRNWVWAAFVPGLTGLAALLLYVAQGGLGGGLGRYDRAIPLLELPASLALLFVDPSGFFATHPPTTYLLLPTALNLVIGLLVARRIKARREAAAV